MQYAREPLKQSQGNEKASASFTAKACAVLRKTRRHPRLRLAGCGCTIRNHRSYSTRKPRSEEQGPLPHVSQAVLLEGSDYVHSYTSASIVIGDFGRFVALASFLLPLLFGVCLWFYRVTS